MPRPASLRNTHPLPGPKDWVDRFGTKPRKGADILVQCLEREGVDIVFAYPGGASMEIHQALTRSDKITNVLCRHEQVRAAARPPQRGSVWLVCRRHHRKHGRRPEKAPPLPLCHAVGRLPAARHAHCNLPLRP